MATIEEIKALRDLTGAGVNAVIEALKETNGNQEEAVKYLRKKGLAKAEKRKEREATEGLFGMYIHTNRKMVTVVEVNCETDFAANSDDMKKFANDLALHVAAIAPEYVSVENIPESVIKTEKDVMEKELEGKPAEVKEKIMEGKLEKFYKDRVLLKQNLFTDESKTVEDTINDLVSKIGEKIEIRAFYIHKISQNTLSSVVNG